VAEHALERTRRLGGTAKERLADIQLLVCDETVDVLFASWGGKSRSHLLEGLLHRLSASNWKALLGFSDVCVSLNTDTAKTAFVTFRGLNATAGLGETLHSDLRILRDGFNRETVDLLGGVEAVGTKVVSGGRARFRLASSTGVGPTVAGPGRSTRPGGRRGRDGTEDPLVDRRVRWLLAARCSCDSCRYCRPLTGGVGGSGSGLGVGA